MILKVLGIHNDSFYNDYVFHYQVITESNDLSEVLEEITDYTKSFPDRFRPIEKFNDRKDKTPNHWGIYIDGKIYISSWEGEYKTDNKSKWKERFLLRKCHIIPGLLKVKSITAIGNGKKNKGINFYITTIKK